jgi:hypothetical protein
MSLVSRGRRLGFAAESDLIRPAPRAMPIHPASSPPPIRPRRRVLVVSGLLNLGLIAALGMTVLGRRVGSEANARRASTKSEASPATSVPGPTAKIESGSTNVVPFRWRELESRDLRVYLANLRSVGCPEATVRHILIAAIEDLYRRLDAEAGVEANFWATSAARQEADRAMKRRQAELIDEQRALVQELLGVEYWGKVENVLMREALLGFLCGHIAPPERREAMAGLIQLYQARTEGVRSEVGNLMRPAEVRELRRLFDEWKAVVKSRFNSVEVEEAWLRLKALMLVVDGDGAGGAESLAGMNLTGSEMRHLVKAAFGDEREVLRMAAENFNLREIAPEEPAANPKERLDAAVRETLGSEKAAAWERAKRSDFQDLVHVARDLEMEPDVAVRAWEVREQTLAAMESARQNPSLDEAGRRAELERQARWAQGRLGEILGEKGFEAYKVRNSGAWLMQQLQESK